MAIRTKRFAGKVCLVTGGGSGIGKAVCKAFALEDAKTIIVDIDAEKGKATEQEITTAGGIAQFVMADVSHSPDVQTAVNTAVAMWGRIDVLVNNAGIMTFDKIIDLDDDDWDRVLQVNLRSVFLFCKYCLPHMNRGAVINISSVHARQTQANVVPYATSKGGMEAFTRALSCEYPPEKIRVNCVAPGGVDTPLLWANPAIKAMKREDVQFASPEQIAAVVCFLASDEAASINGATIAADFGLLAGL